MISAAPQQPDAAASLKASLRILSTEVRALASAVADPSRGDPGKLGLLLAGRALMLQDMTSRLAADGLVSNSVALHVTWVASLVHAKAELVAEHHDKLSGHPLRSLNWLQENLRYVLRTFFHQRETPPPGEAAVLTGS